MGKNDNDEDVREDGYWVCPFCGKGGKCVKGDEMVALAVHLVACKKK